MKTLWPFGKPFIHTREVCFSISGFRQSDAHVGHDSLDAAIEHLRKRADQGATITLYFGDGLYTPRQV